MDDMHDLHEKRVQRERRYQSVMLTACITLVVWMLQTMLALSNNIAAIKPRVDAIDVQLSLMYRASDARRDNSDIAARMTSLESRIDRVERRINGAHP